MILLFFYYIRFTKESVTYAILKTRSRVSTLRFMNKHTPQGA